MIFVYSEIDMNSISQALSVQRRRRGQVCRGASRRIKPVPLLLEGLGTVLLVTQKSRNKIRPSPLQGARRRKGTVPCVTRPWRDARDRPQPFTLLLWLGRGEYTVYVTGLWRDFPLHPVSRYYKDPEKVASCAPSVCLSGADFAARAPAGNRGRRINIPISANEIGVIVFK